MSTTATANPCKVVTGKVRLSYAYLVQPRPGEGDAKPRYQVDAIIPKTDTKTIEKIEAAIEAAKKLGIEKHKWTEKTLKHKDFWNPLRDGDERDDEDPAYAGAMYICAKSNNKPGVVDKALNEIIEADEIYSGMFGRVSIDFWPFDNKSKGIGCGLINVQKLADGDPLGGGRRKPEDDFGDGLEDDDLM